VKIRIHLNTGTIINIICNVEGTAGLRK